MTTNAAYQQQICTISKGIMVSATFWATSLTSILHVSVSHSLAVNDPAEVYPNMWKKISFAQTRRNMNNLTSARITGEPSPLISAADPLRF